MPAVRHLSRIVLAAVAVSVAPALRCQPQIEGVRLDLMQRGELRRLDFRKMCRRRAMDRIGVPERQLERHLPVAARSPMPAELVGDLRAAISNLPPRIARAFERHVCSVVLVTGFGVTGSLVMLDRDASRGLILLNADNLELSANAWATLKDSSFFAIDAQVTIQGHMANADDHGRRELLEYLIVHELGHVIHAALPGEPLVQRFERISWPRRDAYADLKLQAYAEYFGTAPLSSDYVEPLYGFIADSSFPSLTAAMSSGEDLADSLSTYSHSVLAERPWRIEAYRGADLSWRLDSCWSEPRCHYKRLVLEALLDHLAR